MLSWRDLVEFANGDLAQVDPLEMNLLVAKGISSLSHLVVAQYQERADMWASEVRRILPAFEVEFYKNPQDWKNDLRFFRLGAVCWYMDQELGIRYREDQRDLKAVAYTDPSDLFLNGVMDTRRGTCGNMAALHIALGWRLGWPVYFACAGSHIICRYDDGEVTHNIEATNNGKGGFHSHPDEYYIEEYGIPRESVCCGSDLTPLRPREMLGLFVSLRSRHFQDVGRMPQAIEDASLAQRLFPNNRRIRQMATASLLTGKGFKNSARPTIPFDHEVALCPTSVIVESPALVQVFAEMGSSSDDEH